MKQSKPNTVKRSKKKKLTMFQLETRIKVNEKLEKDRKKEERKLNKIKKKVEGRFKEAIGFSLAANGHNKENAENYVIEPPSFRDVKGEKKVDLEELQKGFDSGLESKEIIAIIDKIIEDRQMKDYDEHVIRGTESMRGEECKYGILGVDYKLFGVEPRDFKAIIPLLTSLGLQHYDRNVYNEIDIKSKLQELTNQWKTLDHKKIQDMLNYGIVQELMRTEERKAARRFNKDNQEIGKNKRRCNSAFGKAQYFEPNDFKSNIDKLNDDSNLCEQLKAEDQKDQIKYWDSHGKGGNIKMDYTSVAVKFTLQKKPEMKFIRQPVDNRLTINPDDSVDEEELKLIDLDEALLKIQELMKDIKELKNMKNDILNGRMTDNSKKLRCRPINEKLKVLKRRLKRYEKIRAKHLGVLDKIPKDSPLYRFMSNCKFADKMNKITNKRIEEIRIPHYP